MLCRSPRFGTTTSCAWLRYARVWKEKVHVLARFGFWEQPPSRGCRKNFCKAGRKVVCWGRDQSRSHNPWMLSLLEERAGISWIRSVNNWRIVTHREKHVLQFGHIWECRTSRIGQMIFVILGKGCGGEDTRVVYIIKLAFYVSSRRTSGSLIILLIKRFIGTRSH